MNGASGLAEKTSSLLLSEETNKENDTLKTEHPLVSSIWKMLEEGIPETYEYEITCLPSTRCRKSTADAANLRSLGSKSYNAKNFDEAMMYFSKCVATAPVDSEELAAAYGNRSAIHLFRKNYELCLLDVNRALDGCLPQSTRQILLKRKAMIWEKLQEQNVLRSKLREGISRVQRSDGEKANLKACERKLCYISQVSIDDVDLKIDHSLVDDPIWHTKFDNAELENISPKIELKYDEQFGPHLVAIDDIEPGETLCIDDFYSSTLHEEVVLEYCSYCQAHCEALIACSNCTREMYCSSGCREKAYNSYHRIECKILPLWSDVDDNPRKLRHLILRSFLRVTKQGSKLANLMNSSLVLKTLDGKLNFSDVNFSRENYPLFANVVSRLRCSKYETMIHYEHTVRETLAIFAGLRHVQFFGNKDTETKCSGNILNVQEYFGALLLVYHVSAIWPRILPIKHHLIESLAEPFIVKSTSTGHGFSLLWSFTNHSCDPNVDNVVDGRNILMYSIRSIKAGEQIATVGHTNFMQIAREERQNFSKTLWGQECTCKACVENWPELAELTMCEDFHHIRSGRMISKIKRMRKWLSRRYSCSISEDDLKTVIEFSKTLRQYLKEPSAIIYKFENYIGYVMMLKGNLRVDPKYIAALCTDL